MCIAKEVSLVLQYASCILFKFGISILSPPFSHRRRRQTTGRENLRDNLRYVIVVSTSHWRRLSEAEAAKVSEQVGCGRSACHLLVVPTVDHDS